jgi:hypothetical protein
VAGIWLPSTRVVKPQGYAPISQQWISAGLAAAFMRRGDRIQDVLNNTSPSADTSVPAIDPDGLASSYSGSQYSEFASIPQYAITGALTIIVGVRVSSFSNYTHMVSKQSTTTSNAPFEFRHGVDGSGNSSSSGFNFDFVRASASSYAEFRSGGASSAVGKHINVVRCADGNLATVPTFFQDGAKLSNAVSYPGSGTVADGGNLRVARRYDGSIQLTGNIDFVWIFASAISDAQVVALSANPDSLFEDELTYIPISSALYPTLSALGLTVTSSGVFQSVAYTGKP